MTDKENFEPALIPEKLFFSSSPKTSKIVQKRRYNKTVPQEFAKIENSIVDETESESLSKKKFNRKASEMILPEIKTAQKVHIRKISDDDIVIFKEEELQIPPTVIHKVKRSFWNLCRCMIHTG
jgi:hypothetical protein